MNKIKNWQDVVAKVTCDYPHVKRTSIKFKHLIAAEAENHRLSQLCVHNLAIILGIKLFPRPVGIPIDLYCHLEHWTRICDK
jgi:hypothetical protein